MPGHVLVFPEPGRRRQADPWDSLDSRPSPAAEFQSNNRPCPKKQKKEWMGPEDAQGCPLASTCMLPLRHMHPMHLCMCIHTLKNERKQSFAERTQTLVVESPFLPNTLAGGYTS